MEGKSENSGVIISDGTVEYHRGSEKTSDLIISEGPRTKDLCARCKYETVTLAIIFYIKFSNTKKRPLSQYSLARKHGFE